MNETCITILGMIGLALDLAGVIILFFITDKGLNKIHSPIKEYKVNFTTNANKLQFPKPHPNAILKENIENINSTIINFTHDVNCVINEINRLIEKAEKLNNKRHKKSLLWLGLIILGYALQISAVGLHLAYSHH
jgi:hypothetical protein